MKTLKSFFRFLIHGRELKTGQSYSILNSNFVLCFLIGLFSLTNSVKAQTPAQDLAKNSHYQKDTVINQHSFKIFLGTRGGRFIIVTSKAGINTKNI